MSIEFRIAKNDDISSLHEVWKKVFASTDEMLFFEYYYPKGRCIIAQSDGVVVSMGVLLPCGNYLHNKNTYPCAMIYALATLQEYRERGLGSAIVRKLLELGRSAGYPVTILCPSGDSVFQYYLNNTEFAECFCINEIILPDSFPKSNEAPITQIDPREYLNLRNPLLSGTAHVAMDYHAINYQHKLCTLYGGGLYRVDFNEKTALAGIEKISDKELLIKELLCPPELLQESISVITAKFPCDEYIIRFPAPKDVIPDSRDYSDIFTPLRVRTRKFGMIAATDAIRYSIADEKCTAWYGFAFD